MIDHLKVADPAHLRVYRAQKLPHGVLGITELTARVAKQLDRHDIGIGIGDAPCHQGARIGLHNRRAFELGNEIPHRCTKQHEPNGKRNQQQAVQIEQNHPSGDKVHGDVHHHIGDGHHGIAHGQRGLHHLGRHTP